MLEGIGRNDIIVGAYTGPDGICPMLAAHRAGARTSFLAFARAWDAFALRSSRNRAARRATKHELLALTSHLEASLLEDDGPPPRLGDAIAETLARLERPRARVVRSDRDRPSAAAARG
jgi:hypothetical protein